MSFKREGDDKCLIQNLNNHRVKELLSNHIPEDEAKLLSNGRLTCMICVHRPIFDTINMLAVHRKGKRHIYELSKHIKCKEDAEKRLFLKKELSFSNPSDLPKSSMLGSRSNRNSLQNKRKPILEFKPMVKKKKLEDCKNVNSGGSLVSTTVKQYLKHMSRKSSLDKVVERNRENYGIDLTKEYGDNINQIKTSVVDPEKERAQSTATKIVSQNTDSKEYEMRLRMSGWIKDASGKWIKDPNVEFDSDDDETPPPPQT